MTRKETVYYLEMSQPGDLRPARTPALPFEVKQAEAPCPELNHFFYRAIGGEWYWVDRLPWTRQQWLAYVRAPHFETWIAYLSGTPAGIIELDGAPGSRIDIALLGLLPQFTGHGLGGTLVTLAVRRAWAKGASAVWLHTSSFDHPHALANYQARGFRITREETHWKELPDQPPRFWEPV